MSASLKPVVGVSACLLGERVRYNGDHKKDEWIVSELGRYVSYHVVCPEVAMGLGTPRESMRLEGGADPETMRLRTHETGRDLTNRARQTSAKLVDRVPVLDGFIFKKSSPSCGLERVKIYDANGIPSAVGRGFFAARFVEKFPLVPVIEEGRLSDPEQREQFVVRVYAHYRLRQLPAKGADIQKFHERYKLLLMAHSPTRYRELGRIAANSMKLPPKLVRHKYGELFLDALAIRSSTKKRVNVLQHIFGYFREHLSPKERHAILEIIERYRLEELSFLAAITLVQHQVEQLSLPYLQSQFFFEPYPRALGLRRHL